MIDSSMIVQSAVSSFNNAALLAPSFFWTAVFMLPIFALFYFFGNSLLGQLGWKVFSTPKTRVFNFAFIIEALIFAWLVLMHGNYAVIRDGVSLLPVLVAAIIFVVTASVVQKLRTINPQMPAFWDKVKRKKLVAAIAIIIATAGVGLSGSPTWWGFLLQSAAFICGAIAGRYWEREVVNPILMITVLISSVVTAILMQPEFFRFGQLGNLTIIHLLFISFFVGLVAGIMAVRNVNPRKRVHHSAYIKLKWMARIISILCFIMFIFTESVIVFLAFAVVLFASFAMSVWHAESIPENLSKNLWALLICSFGIMTTLPVITIIGILYWTALPKSNVWRQSKFLL